MRLEVIEPQQLTADQKPLYRDIKEGIEATFKGFKAIREDGALLGPWNPWINFSHLGKPTWEPDIRTPRTRAPSESGDVIATSRTIRSSALMTFPAGIADILICRLRKLHFAAMFSCRLFRRRSMQEYFMLVEVKGSARGSGVNSVLCSRS
jgi:hypothetical protein